MRELDAALLCYLEHHYDTGSEDERLAFRELLGMPDPELMRLIAGKPLNAYPLVPESENGNAINSGETIQDNPTQGRDKNGSFTSCKTDTNCKGAERTLAGAVQLPEKRYGPIIEKIRTTLIA